MTYQPTRWNDGDTITAEKMNHLPSAESAVIGRGKIGTAKI